MKLTLRQIEEINTNTAFQSLIEKDLPIRVSFQLARLLKKTSEEFDLLQQKRNELINKYAEKDGDNVIVNPDGTIPLIKSKVTEFNSAIVDLYSVIIGIDIEKVKISMDDTPNMSTAEVLAVIDVIDFIEPE